MVLNQGIRVYEAVLFFPLYQSQLIIFGVLNGSLSFGEFAAYDTKMALGFTFGLLVEVRGVLYLLTRGQEEEDGAAGASAEEAEKGTLGLQMGEVGSL